MCLVLQDLTTCSQGQSLYIRVQQFNIFLQKLRIGIIYQVQNKILRPVYKTAFFHICSIASEFWYKGSKKYEQDPSKKNLEKNQKGCKKTQHFMLSKKLFKRLQKCSPRKSYTQKTKLIICKSQKVHFQFSILLMTFFACCLVIFSADHKSAWNFGFLTKI